LGSITTVAVPLYSSSSKEVDGVFLGVVGHGVILSELGAGEDEIGETLEAEALRYRFLSIVNRNVVARVQCEAKLLQFEPPLLYYFNSTSHISDSIGNLHHEQQTPGTMKA